MELRPDVTSAERASELHTQQKKKAREEREREGEGD